MSKRWIIHTDLTVSGFSDVEIGERHACDFDDPTTYPIGTALPIVFDNQRDAWRCVAWLEQLVGRLTMAGKIAPTTVNNYYPQVSAQEMVRQTIERIAQQADQRPIGGAA